MAEAGSEVGGWSDDRSDQYDAVTARRLNHFAAPRLPGTTAVNNVPLGSATGRRRGGDGADGMLMGLTGAGDGTDALPGDYERDGGGLQVNGAIK